jgi:acyl-CoA thioester hydrolase
MPRIKIEVSGRLLSTITLPVRITDINYGNHTGNEAIVAMMQEARMNWLKKYSYTELNIEGTGLIMSDLAVEFKAESFYGDILEIQLFTDEITKVSFGLFYMVTTTRNKKTIIVAKAKSGMVCFDYALKKVAPLPGKLLMILDESPD